MAALEAGFRLAGDAPDVVATYLVGLVEAQKYDRALAESARYVDKAHVGPLAQAVRARALGGLRRPAEAETALVALLKAKLARVQLVQVSMQLSGTYDKQAAAKVQAWARDSQLPQGQMFSLLGMLYTDAQDHAAAATSLDRARGLAENQADKDFLGQLLGMAYYNARDYDKAERIYLEVLKSRPDELQVLNNLAYLYANDRKDARSALPHARRALELAIGNANVVDTYGWVLVQLNRHAEAVETLRRAVAVSPRTPVFRYHLAYAHEMNGQLAQAVEQYEQGEKLSVRQEDDAILKSCRECAERVRKKLRPE
jgi:tetratricopeptide (TPR) repeat protein